MAEEKSWPRRILWFVGLWAASVTAVATVAYGIRLWIL